MNSSSADVPRVAVIGMGYWGKNLVRNFAELGALAMVCDSDDQREASLAKGYPGVFFSTQYQTALESSDIDAIVLGTPAVTHFDMAHAAISAGKDVYVEKPLALSVSEGETLVAHAAQHNRILMVGHILQYHPAVRRLKTLINDGVLGRVQYVYSNRLNMGKVRTEENILWSFAPHDISVILGLLEEEPCATECSGGAYLSEGIPDVTMSQFLFPSGVRAHIHVSWLHPFKEQRLVVIGSGCMAVFDDTAEDKLQLYPHRVEWNNDIPTAIKAEAEAVPLPSEEPLRNECSHFLDCIAKRASPLTDGQEGLRVLKVLSACEQKLQTAQDGTPQEGA